MEDPWQSKHQWRIEDPRCPNQ
uniref:Uncharacterized protein n=1 Tax=Arundo donax TaxID=35708 RepID=A0A0A9H5T6_ARUDO